MSFPRYSKYKASGVEWLGDFYGAVSFPDGPSGRLELG